MDGCKDDRTDIYKHTISTTIDVLNKYTSFVLLHFKRKKESKENLKE